MKLKAVLVVIFVFSMMLIQAQNQEDNKVKYSNITEWGLLGSPSERFIAFEGTTVNGFAIGGHNLGIGLGLGLGGDMDAAEPGVYCPIFINYRYYFNPLKSFTPHINVALGGMSRVEAMGIYSTLTTGFRSHKFSFSSGFFFQAYESEIWDYDQYGIYYNTNKKEWRYPWGIMIKVGFSF
ncbi:MAG: hypothetical protein PHC83_03820 [Bacteroidales bacterium]|nr:hypothetical protein [Bacteroidales bacterium]MDD4210157.1 hypothetical protein [Bacteroidales bacterium]